jgi:hypothetical protein
MLNRRAGDCSEEVDDYMPGDNLPFALPASLAAYMTGERVGIKGISVG